MEDQEINRAIQYVTARTSYAQDVIAEIIRTGLSEMTALACSSEQTFERKTLIEYVSCWAIKRTGHPEPMVREVLECAGKWLDEMYEAISRNHPELLQGPGKEGE